MKKKVQKPPRVAEWLLSHTIDRNNRDFLLGDFEEFYTEIRKETGALNALAWYWIQVFKSIPHFISNFIYWRIVMFTNYLKLAIKNLIRHKLYSFINVFGLTLGIASCILLLSYINFEISFDKYHKNANRIYRIVAKGKMSGDDYANAKISAAMTPLLLNDYPEIENIVRFLPDNLNLFRYKDKKHYEPHFMFVDSSVFKVFSYSLIAGDEQTALKAPNSLVLTQEAAYKYFGDENPIGKVFKFNNEFDLTVTGIIQKPPANSHIQFDMLISFETLHEYWPYVLSSRRFASCYTYVILKEGVDYKNFEMKLNGFFDRHIGDLLEPVGGKLSCFAQPLTSIHLHSNLQNEISGNANILYVYSFGVIAILILLIACINYINLSTARSAVRAKEVGMRKVIGALREQIIRQFLGESLFYGVLAIVLSILLVMATLPYFRDITGQILNIDFMEKPHFWIELIVIMIFVCLIAGGYPAFFLSGFKPIQTLKGVLTKGRGNSNFRNALVVLQFTILIALIIMTVGVFSQLKYLKNKNLGFDREQLLFVKIYEDHTNTDNRIRWLNTMKSELIKLDGVVNASLSSHVPGTRYYQGQFIPDGFLESETFNMEEYFIDDNFLATFGIELVEGRGFSKEFLSDTDNAVILNISAVNQFGWTNPIGKKIKMIGRSETREYYIVGVVKDIHSRTLHNTIEPLIFFNSSHFHNLTLRLKPENMTQTIKSIQAIWNDFEPFHPFEYSFLDENLDRQYKTEVVMGKVIQIFTFLAICIGCLGLFGLMLFITQQRTKEIGIRKTVGASTTNVAALLMKESIKWVLLGNIIAWPIAYFAVNRWLESFAYRIDIGLDIFIFSGTLALIIAIFTVGYQALKAATANPVEALKYE